MARVSAWALALDAVIAVAATALAISEVLARAHGDFPPVERLAVVALMALPLAVRRLYPVTASAVIFVAACADPRDVPPIIFATALFAVFSAVLHSPHRELALGVAAAGAIATDMTFPYSLPVIPERYTALIAVVPTMAAGLGIRELRLRVGDSAARLRKVQAEHEAATRRAIDLERARIASELHDVVTHNVSVMMVQAGAARKVLGSPREDAAGLAEDALLAVEASGRTAMGELRNLLSLLAPAAGSEQAGDAPLTPQPGVADVRALVDRVSKAGLPVTLRCSLPAGGLPAGLDLAVYRVVQEGLTNVLRHGGGAATAVGISGRLGRLVVTVSDDGSGAKGGGGDPGRGLLGLRERIALYGGTVDAGPRPGGGWRLRATIPLDEEPARV
jgi:signal transduction histidine kinase